MVSIIILALVVLFGGSAQAATYYVSTTGSNSNDGLTEDTPWRTIGFAVTTMNAGDTTYVREGTYSTETNITFAKTGTQALPIKLLAYPGEAPVIDFQIKDESRRMLIKHPVGNANAIAWITIEGFEILNSWECMKGYNLQDTTIRRNWCHDNARQGILFNGGLRVLIDRNVFDTNGRIAECAAGTVNCNQDHGIYAYGGSYTITNNIFYNNQGYGIQLNGSPSSAYSALKHPSTAFAGAANWIVANNVFAYSYGRAGITVWGSLCTNARIENNIFYENAASSNSEPQGVKFTSTTCTGVMIRNNLSFASGSGGTTFLGSGAPGDLVNSGNVVGNPLFVDGGSNSLPAFPDWTLSPSSPALNIGRDRGASFCGAAPEAGAFEVCGPSSATINGHFLDVTFSAVNPPIRSVLGNEGWSVSCTPSCGGSPTVTSVQGLVGSSSVLRLDISGISGTNCVAGKTWTVSFDASTGLVSDSALIGSASVYMYRNQRAFSFTNFPVTNDCSGSPPSTTYPGTPYIYYLMNDGNGVTLTNSGSGGPGLNGTLINGAGWDVGKTGFGVAITAGTSQYIGIPYGSGVNPTVSNMTIAWGTRIAVGAENAVRSEFGTSIGVDQRYYVKSLGGTARLGLQTSNANVSTSNATLTSEWNHFCINSNATTDVVTLYLNGQPRTGGAEKSMTSFVLASNFTLGKFDADIAPGGVYEDFLLYQSIEDCAAIYAAFEPTSTTTGTFAQAAFRFQGVYENTAGSPIDFGTAINQSQDVVASGGVGVIVQIHCQDIADCEQTSFPLEARRNGIGSFVPIPDMQGSDNIWMWGASSLPGINTSATTTRLTGSCDVTTGSTFLTSNQSQSFDLPQDGCVMIRYIVRVGDNIGDYYELRAIDGSGNAFAGGYVYPRINVIAPMASGF